MKPKSSLRSFLILAGSSLLATSFVHAADGTWNGITGNWTDTTISGGVWSGGTIADGADSTAFFTGVDIAADQVITLNGNRTIGNITFTDATTSSHNLTITGNTLTLDRTSGVPSIDVTQADRTLAISSIIAGNDGLQKNGAGTLRLTAANTLTGGLTINAGTVFLNPATGVNPLSSGKATIGDVANTGAAAELLYIGTTGNNSFNNLIDVRGNGTATIRVLGFNPTFSGAVNLGNNLTVISNNNAGSTIGLSGGVTGTGNLVIQSNAANGGASSAITFSSGSVNMIGTITNSGTTTSTTASNTTISAVIGTNVTGITQNSANSQLILTANNTFTGNIAISAGTLNANLTQGGNNPTSGALGNPSTAGRQITIASGGTLNFNNVDVLGQGGTSNTLLTLIANGGTIRNNVNGINTLGPVQLNGGTLTSTATGTNGFKLTGTVTVGGSAVSTISAASGIIGSGGVITYDVADAVVGSGSDLNVTAVVGGIYGAGGITKTGVGTMTLSNQNTYTGVTRIDNGTLALGANNTLPAFPVAIGAGTLDAATFDDATIGTLDVSDAASTIKLGSGANLAFAASNAVDWTGGTLNLTGTLNFSGGSSSSLRFGTTNVGPTAGLTPGQLLQIASPGWTNFALDADGYLTATPISGSTFAAWQSANGTTQTIDQDHDGDGVSNGVEFFIYGPVANSGFTPLPGLTAGSPLSVTWTKAAGYTGTYGTHYLVETSDTLASGSWAAEPNPGSTISFPSSTEVKYTFPAGTKNFARLKVTGP